MNEIKELFEILYKQKKIIFAASFLCSTLFLFISYAFDDEYESESTILVKSLGSNNNFGTINNFSLGFDLLGSGNKGTYLQRSLAFFYSIEFARIIQNNDKTLPLLFATKGYDKEKNETIINYDIYDPKTKVWTRDKPFPFDRKPQDIEILRKVKSTLDIFLNSNSGFIEIKVRSKSPIAAYELSEDFISFANNFIVSQDLSEIDEAIKLTDQLISQNISKLGLQDSLSLIKEENLKKKIYIQSSANFPLQKVQSPYIDINRVFPNRIFFIMIGFLIGFILSSTFILLRSK